KAGAMPGPWAERFGKSRINDSSVSRGYQGVISRLQSSGGKYLRFLTANNVEHCRVDEPVAGQHIAASGSKRGSLQIRDRSTCLADDERAARDVPRMQIPLPES